jgi:hypothetical protein
MSQWLEYLVGGSASQAKEGVGQRSICVEAALSVAKGKSELKQIIPAREAAIAISLPPAIAAKRMISSRMDAAVNGPVCD